MNIGKDWNEEDLGDKNREDCRGRGGFGRIEEEERV
jgi:hypothetical protein